MRPLVGLAILAASGVAAACLFVGVGAATACASPMAPVACLGDSAASIHDLFGLLIAASATVGVLLVLSILCQTRRHWRLAELLDHTARWAWLADHQVGLVPGLTAPCVAGLARPRIFCPADLAERLSERELRAVVLHERHHQLAHAPARLIILAALAPALERLEVGQRWVERRRAAIEIAADDHALGAGAGRPELARALLKLSPVGLDAGLPGFASVSELRLRHLVGAPTPASSRRLGALAILAMTAGAFVGCLAWTLIA